MTLCAFVVDVIFVRDVVDVEVVGSLVGLIAAGGAGFNGRTFSVGDGELLAWPFLLDDEGLLGRRGITSSRTVAGSFSSAKLSI